MEKKLKCSLVLFAALFIGLGKNTSRTQEKPRDDKEHLDTLVAGGDVIIARREHDYVARHGLEWPFISVKRYLESGDATLVNLETCVALGGHPQWKGERNPCYFRARPEMLNILVLAGIDIVNCANNHAGDYGEQAVIETAYWLDMAGLVHTGFGKDPKEALTPRLVKVGNTRVAIIGMDTTMPSYCVSQKRPGTNHVPEGDLEIFEGRVKWLGGWARRRCDLLILTIHWGRNWDRETSAIHRKMARIAFDAGVDLILGHSAHRLQGVEIVNGKMAIYDMGNLMIDGIYRPEGQLGGIFRLKISRKGVKRLEMVPVWLPAARTILPTSSQRQKILAEMKELCGKLGTEMKVRKDEYGQDMGVIEVENPNVSPKGPMIEGLKFEEFPKAKLIDTNIVYKFMRPRDIMGNAIPEEAERLEPPRELYPGIELLAFMLPKRASLGTQIPARTWWRLTKKIKEPLLISFELVSGGKVVRSARYNRHDPGDWALPFRYIRPNEIIKDPFPLRLGTKVPEGPCTVRVLIYDPTKPEEKRITGTPFTLGTVEIVED